MQFRLGDTLLLILVIVLFFSGGCGDSRPKRVPVSGKILIDGEPLAYGSVTFVPDGGRQSTGTLDKSGNFTLTCFESGDGALIGTHHVQVLANEVINTTTTKWHAPKKYADRRTSGLVQEIKDPTDSLVINLTWKGNTPDKAFTEHAESDPAEEAFARSRRKK
jgi:hypothetical protein